MPMTMLTRQQVRHAGHNKWSNIRHIKGAKDLENSKKYRLYTHKINQAIKENGGDLNPGTNRSLQKIVSEALASHVPKATIEKQLKNYKSNADSMIEYLYEVRGPGRVGVLIECL